MADWDTCNFNEAYSNDQVYSNDGVYSNDQVNSNDRVYTNDKVHSNDHVYGNDKVPCNEKVYENDKVRSNENVYGNDNSQLPHSRQSSYSSGLSSDHGLALTGGENLSQESITDTMPVLYQNLTSLEQNGTSQPNRQITTPRDVNTGSSGTAKAKAAKSPYAPSTIESVPKEEISIPNDANISAFSKDQIANFMRCLKIDDRIISHLHRKNVDGKRFSRLKDSELESLNMKNPVIMFFRDKSQVKSNKTKRSTTGAWVL